MKRWAPYALGILAGAAFAVGWFFDPSQLAVLIVALVCGTGSAYFQVSGREMLGRIQSLIERGIETAYEDGGALLETARQGRARVMALARRQLLFAAFAPALATASVGLGHKFFSAAALACAVAAVALALMMDRAALELATLVEDEKVRRNAREKLRSYSKERKEPAATEKLASEYPNLGRYTAESVEAETK